MVEELTAQTFEEKINTGVVVIDFWAPWCAPCKSLGPVFEETSGEVSGASFFKINVDDNQELSGKYGIMSIPCIIIFKDGVEVDRIMGFPGADQLKEMIADAVSKAQ